MIVHGHSCDTCGGIDSTHPDDGPPTGWFLVARMTQPGCWDDDEWHFCGYTCLRRWKHEGGHGD